VNAVHDTLNVAVEAIKVRAGRVAVLYHTILYRNILYSTVLCSDVLYCTVLSGAVRIKSYEH
jgi:hypothetical protein